jgi:Family of unknown function (DUF6152)
MKRIGTFTVALLLIWVAAATAHHPFAAEYDWKRPVTLTGTVQSLDWKNPHSILMVKGKDDKGTEGEWTVELGGPGQLSRSGWTRTSLKAGDHVSVDGWMAKDNSKRLSGKSVTLSGGRELFAASSFYDAKVAAAAHPKTTTGTSGKSTPTAVR